MLMFMAGTRAFSMPVPTRMMLGMLPCTSFTKQKDMHLASFMRT